MAAIIAVNAFQTIGFVSVVQLLLAESFPTEIRSASYNSIQQSKVLVFLDGSLGQSKGVNFAMIPPFRVEEVSEVRN